MDWYVIARLILFALNCIGIGMIIGLYIGYRYFAAHSGESK